jgi:hypothetical protein
MLKTAYESLLISLMSVLKLPHTFYQKVGSDRELNWFWGMQRRASQTFYRLVSKKALTASLKR